MGNRKKKRLVREQEKPDITKKPNITKNSDITNKESENEVITKSAKETVPSQPKHHSTLKKAFAAIFLVCAVSAMVALAFGKVTPLNFWLITIFCAAFAWIVLPRMK